MMPADPDSKTNQPESDPLWVAANATDTYWWLLTGCCGGCGRRECHPLPCPSKPGIGFCLTCPTRRETGEVR